MHAPTARSNNSLPPLSISARSPFRSFLPYAVLLFFAVFPALAQTTPDIRTATITVEPARGVPGQDYGIVLRSIQASCGQNGPLFHATVQGMAGSGLEVTQTENSSGCQWVGKVHVSATAVFGNQNLEITNAKQGKDVVAFQVVAVPPGPVPPGVNPGADITWKVLPRRVVSDNFGARIAKLYYAVEVVIGNDTGYDLQIAAVNFQLPGLTGLDTPVPTDGYRVVRGTLQREQEIGLRNTIVNVVKGIGPVLTGATLFFRGSSIAALHHKGTYEGIVNIFSNPFEKGLELAFPDRTVSQLVQLDNQTLRDGMIVANNVQQRTLVFISRDILQQNPIASETLRKQSPKFLSATDHLATAQTIGVAATRKKMKSRLKSEFDPQEVMRQLGRLVLVGNMVNYVQRVRVVSTPLPDINGPQVASQTGNSGKPDSTATLVLTGQHLDGADILTPSGSALSRESVLIESGGTKLTAIIKIGAAAVPASYLLRVVTSAGIATAAFTVTAPGAQ